jgi:hypothetical protein
MRSNGVKLENMLLKMKINDVLTEKENEEEMNLDAKNKY